MWIAVTIIVALAGAYLLQRLKVPAGLLLGAVMAVGLLNICCGKAYIWPQARIFSQIVAGTYLGCLVTKKDLRLLPKIIWPYLMIMCSFLVLNISVGFLLHKITDLSLITCLLSSMPGGISDSPLIAMDMGADVSVVVVLQFIRVIFGLAFLPALIQLADRVIEPETARQIEANAHHGTNSTNKKKELLLPFLPTLCVGTIAGLLGYFSGIAAGTLSFSLLAVGIMSVAGKNPPMPNWIRVIAQLLCGCCIGVTVELEHFLRIPSLLLPAIINCAGYFIVCMVMGYIISKLFKMQLREAMLCLAPAGAVEMTFIAADLGVESPTLGIIQMFRLIAVMLFFPQLFGLIVSIF